MHNGLVFEEHVLGQKIGLSGVIDHPVYMYIYIIKLPISRILAVLIMFCVIKAV